MTLCSGTLVMIISLSLFVHCLCDMELLSEKAGVLVCLQDADEERGKGGGFIIIESPAR